MLYTAVSRTDVDRTLLLFDFPDPNAVPEQRSITVGPLQRLYFLNSNFVMGQAKRLAERVQKEAAGNNAARIRRAYELLFSRPPAESEIAVGLNFLSRDASAWERYAQVLLASTEFSSVN
jgi:hypothetical protein